MFRMHSAHLANVSKSVTKNATFPRTGGLPCLITHSCMSAASPTVVGGLIFCNSATPHLGSLFPLFHVTNTRWGSIQMWGRKLVKPSQEEETEVGRLLNSVPPFHLMWKLMLEPTSLRLWRNASPATTNSTKFAIGTPSSWTTIGQKRPTLDVVLISKNVLENKKDL